MRYQDIHVGRRYIIHNQVTECVRKEGSRMWFAFNPDRDTPRVREIPGREVMETAEDHNERLDRLGEIRSISVQLAKHVPDVTVVPHVHPDGRVNCVFPVSELALIVALLDRHAAQPDLTLADVLA